MTSITLDQIFNELQMLNVKQLLTGDSRDQSERTKDSECSQSFHVKTTALFSYRSLHSAEVVDGIHGNGEQTEEEDGGFSQTQVSKISLVWDGDERGQQREATGRQ